MKIDINLILQNVEDGYINIQSHPNKKLFIYNYAAEAQYDKVWNQATLACRGLILDANHNIIAHPFPKFFNIEEHEPKDIPNLPFEVYEKMDGSLGILYWLEEKPYIASRGSFDSEQALKATELLYTKYLDAISKLEQDKTYLFEIIYPSNRIVVDYGEAETLTLLGINDTQSGTPLPLENIGFPTVPMYDGMDDFEKLKALALDNKEGFVILFENGFRVKIKFEEYVRLHKILTKVSNRTIWEYLSKKLDFKELLEKVPDEFYQWVKKTKASLLDNFNQKTAEINLIFEDLPFPKNAEGQPIKEGENLDKSQRKTLAHEILKRPYDSILFSKLDCRNIDKEVWELVYPDYKKPFIEDF